MSGSQHDDMRESHQEDPNQYLSPNEAASPFI